MYVLCNGCMCVFVCQAGGGGEGANQHNQTGGAFSGTKKQRSRRGGKHRYGFI